MNPLHCSDVFKRVGAAFCYDCPSMNGLISACRHLGFLYEALFAPYVFVESTNKPVRLVNIKNKFPFLHPEETLHLTKKTVDLPGKVKRISEEKRPNDLFLHTEKVIDDEEFRILYGFSSSHGTETEIRDEAPVADAIAIENDSQELPFDTLNPSNTCQPANDAEMTDTCQPVNDSEMIISQSQSEGPAINFGMYGSSSGDIDKFIKKKTKRRPGWIIPNPSQHSGRILQSFQGSFERTVSPLWILSVRYVHRNIVNFDNILIFN